VNSEKGKKSEKNVWKSMTMHERFIIKKKNLLNLKKIFLILWMWRKWRKEECLQTWDYFKLSKKVL